ncbi:hypothetical protein [Streptomyces sp. 6N223]|uniref:hypothetical protein n=1 Tax=Streptomyces sp. 6N223 TaxID=3457412 RepID=UPI003FD544D1
MRKLRSLGTRAAVVGGLTGLAVMVSTAGSAQAAQIDTGLAPTVGALAHLLATLGIFL